MTELIEIPTETEITDRMKSYIITKHPLIRNFSPLSLISILNEAVAIEGVALYERIQNKANSLSIFMATGDALSARVLDRLPEGRLPGDKSSGNVTFSRDSVATQEYIIPIETKLKAIGQDGTSTYFTTTEEGTIPIGSYSVTVGAEALYSGINGNVPAGAIKIISDTIYGVPNVENNYAFSGGTDTESDTDLRNRYILSWNATGTSTTQLIEQHIKDLEDVTECHVYTSGPGDIEVIIDYSGGIGDDNLDIVNTLESNVAGGIVCCGVLGATILSGIITPSIDLSKGGRIWVRPRAHVTSDDTMTIRYMNTNNVEKDVVVQIPQDTERGTGVLVAFDPVTDRAIEITDIIYSGSKSYDLYIGMGIYPYLYTLPRTAYVSVVVNLTATETPEIDMKENIQASIEAFLDSYKIGESLEYSDVYIKTFYDHLTDRKIVGIDSIQSLTISGGGISINQSGQVITIDEDQRIDPGTVTVNITYV